MKITKAMIESIVEKETNKKFKEKIDTAYKIIIEEFQKEVVAKHQPIKIPQNLIDEQYIRMEGTVGVRLDGMKYEKHFEMYNSYPCKVFESHFSIKPTEKLNKLYKKYTDLQDERNNFRSELTTIISGFTNHKVLVVHLPELKPYFVDLDMAKSMAVIPVERIKNIRSQLVLQ